MRVLETFYVVAFLGAVALGVWNFRHQLPPYFADLVESTVLGAPAVTRVPDLQVKPSVTAIKSTGRISQKKPSSLDEMGTSVVEINSPAPHFPDTKDLRAGLTGDQIIAEFGQPTARVTTSEDGRLVERYYYLNRERTRLIVANLQNGQVVSADKSPRE